MDVCKIEDCRDEVMGCSSADGCPAEDLCQWHYFALALIRGQGHVSFGGNLGGQLKRDMKQLAVRDRAKLDRYWESRVARERQP